MQLSELLGCTVRDAGSHEVGTVVDVRLSVAGDLERNCSPLQEREGFAHDETELHI